MRIAFAQMDSVLGNIDTNYQQILSFVERAKDKRAELLIFPELALIGYLPQDLLDREELIAYQEKKLAEISKKIPKDMAVIVG
jgi:NAD+ synthase (glutamine-hydrolysing)